jgi:hypothetical protein
VRRTTDVVAGPRGWLVFAADDRHVYGIARQGVARWRTAIGQAAAVAAPAVDRKGRVVLGTTGGQLQVLEPFVKRQRVELGGPVVSAPRVGRDGRIWVVAGRTLFALDSELRVRLRRPGVVAAAPWSGGVVVVESTGTLAWLDAEYTPVATALVAGAEHELVVDADGRAYIAADAGALVIAGPQREQERVRVGHAPLRAVVYDGARGRVLALAGDGRLAVVRAARKARAAAVQSVTSPAARGAR